MTYTSSPTSREQLISPPLRSAAFSDRSGLPHHHLGPFVTGLPLSTILQPLPDSSPLRGAAFACVPLVHSWPSQRFLPARGEHCGYLVHRTMGRQDQNGQDNALGRLCRGDGASRRQVSPFGGYYWVGMKLGGWWKVAGASEHALRPPSVRIHPHTATSCDEGADPRLFFAATSYDTSTSTMSSILRSLDPKWSSS